MAEMAIIIVVIIVVVLCATVFWEGD